MYTLFVILIVIAAVLMIGIVLIRLRVVACLQASHLTTRLVVFARPLTSSRKPHGASLLLWSLSALSAHGLLLQLQQTTL